MEVVSTSNIVSLENKKTTTVCNFQTMAMNSFFVSHDLMRDQIGSHAYMQAKIMKNTLRKHIFSK